MNPLCYRNWLASELLDRRARNPAYSARAMARQLGLSPAFFSQILAGKKTLREERARTVAGRLGWRGRKKRLFVNLVRLEKIEEPESKQELAQEVARQAAGDPENYHIGMDRFRLISDWYHYAILELTTVEGFQSDAGWIAKRLGITAVEVRVALERLQRVGLLAEVGGRWRRTKTDYHAGDVPSEAVRAFHRQILHRARLALASQPLEAREFSGMTFAISRSRVAELKALVRAFAREARETVRPEAADAVYHFSMQLFRLDKETS